jgi:ketosteroid isomerase-like protein
MSQENVELVRREWERWNAGEREIDTEVIHPDLVVHSVMTNSTYHGHNGLRRWMAEIDDQFKDWRLLIDQFRDASDGRLLVLGAVHFRGRTSGVEFDQPMGWLLTFAGGQLIELRNIPDHAEALKAAGLSE